MVEMPILVIHSGEAPLHVPLNYADTWRGVSKRHGSASYSGSGGKASGGSVKKPCSRRRAVSRVLPDSGASENGLTEQWKLGESSTTSIFNSLNYSISKMAEPRLIQAWEVMLLEGAWRVVTA
jgi:hypothetical protein